MSPLVAEFVGAVVRFLLTAAGAALVSRNIISAEQLPRFVEGFSGPLLSAALMALALAWSLWHKYWSRLKLRAARELPAGADVNRRVEPRGRAVGVGLKHRRAQGRQAASAAETGQRQSARRERIADMNQGPRQIVDRVERAEAGDQVEPGCGKRGLFGKPGRRFGLADLYAAIA